MGKLRGGFLKWNLKVEFVEIYDLTFRSVVRKHDKKHTYNIMRKDAK